jgi:hypothetical protein
MDQSTTVTANFAAAVTLRVIKAGPGGGTVTNEAGPPIDCGTVCTTLVATGTIVTLTATPDAGSRFAGWSGGCTGTAACIVTLDQARTVTATFAWIATTTVAITQLGAATGTVTSSPGGISCTPTCSAGFVPGSQVTLTAIAGPGSRFGGWGGSCSGSAPVCTFVAPSADTTVTALFVVLAPGSVVVSSVTPSVLAQGTARVVDVFGSGFTAASTVNVTDPGLAFGPPGSAGVTITQLLLVSPTHLRMTLTAAATATTGPRDLRVQTGTTSGVCIDCLTITARPIVTGAPAPWGVLRGATRVDIVLNGSGFQPAATVGFTTQTGGPSGISVNTVTVTSPTSMTLNITIAPGAPPGIRRLTITNPDGGTTTTGFTILAAGSVVVSSVTPSVLAQGTARVVDVFGSGFTAGSAVTVTLSSPLGFGGPAPAGVTITRLQVISPTQLRMTLTAAANTPIGLRDLRVQTGTTTGVCIACLNITARPSVTGAPAPWGALRGTTRLDVVLTGSGFQPAPTIAFTTPNGGPSGITVNTVTVASPTTMTLNITINPGTPPGNRQLTITNPDGGTTTTSFTILGP